MVMKFDPYGTLMINHGNRILILLHFYCNSKHELSTILIANVANLSRIVTLTDFDSTHNSCHFVYFICTYYFGYWIITIMGYSKHELSTINMLHSLKKIVIPHLYLPLTATSPQRTLSSVPKVSVVKRLDCSWKGGTKQITSLL